MIRLNEDKILLCILILSCLINGILFEGLFFLMLAVLIFRNRNSIYSNKYYRWFILVVILYAILLVLSMFYFKTSSGWRPVGITKVLCGMSLCILFNDRLCKNNIERIIIVFLIIFNVLFSIFGVASESKFLLFHIFEYPGQNTLGALNLISMPHIIRSFKGKDRILHVLYFLSYFSFFVRNIGFTTVFCSAIILGWCIFSFLKENVHIKKKITIKEMKKLIPFVLALMIILFYGNANFRNVYLSALEKTDIDRYTILSQALYRISNATPKELLWGRGDNNYFMLSGRYIAAHNFIVEIITFDGLAGLFVLTIETYVFIRFMMMKVSKLECKHTVILSLALGYLFFLLHPIYTTSFLVKLFFVLFNLRACNYYSENEVVAHPQGGFWGG